MTRKGPALLTLAHLALAAVVGATGPAPIPVVLVAIEGDSPAGSGGDPISVLNSPFTTGTGQVGFTGALQRASGTDNFVWFDGGFVWFNSNAAPGNLLAGAESTMGVGDAGQFLYSPAIDGEDGVWTHNGALLVADQAAPGFPAGTFISFNSRPQMGPAGQSYWVAGFTDIIGGSTQGRVVYRSNDSTPGATTVVLRSDDLVGGLPIDRPSGIGFDYQFSDNGLHHIHALVLDTGATTNDDIVYVDGAIVAREASPTGSGDNWDDFDAVSINNDGDYIFSGDTDGATATDEFIAHNATIVLREGQVVDGVTLGTSVQAAAINDLGQAVFIWNDGGGGEHLFFASDASNLGGATRLLSTGDLIDTNNDTLPNFEVVDFNASITIGPGLDLAEDGFVYVEVDVIAVAGVLGIDVEAIIRLGLPVPDIAVAPPSHDYGAVMLGASATQTFTVSNLGLADLTVSATAIVGDADFQITMGAGAFVLAPNATHDIEVEVTTAALGSRTAELQIASDDPDTPLLTVALAAEGVPVPVPNIVVDPASYDFGPVEIGTGATWIFTVDNDGDATLDVSASDITGLDSADFQIIAGGGAFSLIPGASHQIEVEFSPGSVGPKVAALELTSNDPDSPVLSVPLTGEGTSLPNPLEIPTASTWALLLLVGLLAALGLRALGTRAG